MAQLHRPSAAWLVSIFFAPIAAGACGGDTAGGQGNAAYVVDAATANGGAAATASTMGGSGGGPAGAGGAPTNARCIASNATTPSECFFDPSCGVGGSDGVARWVLRVALSEPLPVSNTHIRVEAPDGGSLSLGELYRFPWSNISSSSSQFAFSSYSSETLPSKFSVTVMSGSVIVGTGTFQPRYSCVAETPDDWFWIPDPVTVDVTLPPSPSDGGPD